MATPAIQKEKLTEVIDSSKGPLHHAKLMENVKTNNHHVVPVGILIVLFTLYITATALQSHYNCFFKKIEKKSNLALEEESFNSKGQLNIKEDSQITILNQLREHESSCYVMEIFIKDLPMDKSSENYGMETLLKTPKKTYKKQSKKTMPNKMIKSNGNGYSMGKEAKDKNLKNSDAKRKDTQKKNSTAEPIIYLFALVFIYLLLKAASDINQHYKAQNKNDKRLRRCSLQSYAQAHKQDRRASKDSPLRRKSRIFENRSISVDRFKLQVPIKENDDVKVTLKSEILSNFRKYTSLDEKPKSRPSYLPTSPPLLPFSPFKGGSGRSEVFKYPDTKPILGFSSLNSNRRSSMPVTINYQPVPLIPGNPSRPLLRRTSMIGCGISGLTMDVAGDSMNSGLMEPKRRVRMINRH